MLLKAIVRLVLTAAVFAVVATCVGVLLSLFFKGSEFLDGFGLTQFVNDCRKNFVLMLVAICIAQLLGHIGFGRADDSLSPRSLGGVTKALIYFPGLPLFGALGSMIFLRLSEIIGLGINDTHIVVVFTLIFWGYGAYLCKTRYFNKI
jgi:hypothetical protein